MDWGTHACLHKMPQWFTFTSHESAYTIDSHQFNNSTDHFLGTGLYVDQATTDWTVSETATSGVYTISNGGNYLAGNGTDAAITTTTDGTAAAAQWQLISKSDFETTLATATAAIGVDATPYIKDPELKRNGNFITYTTHPWTIKSFDGSADPGNFAQGQNGNNASCAESFQSSNGFKATQTLTGLRAGKYELTAQAFYRQDGSDTEHMPYLFVGDQKSIFPERTGTENNMPDAYASFLNGTYPVDAIEFLVTSTSQEINIGYANENVKMWNIFGETQLTYFGNAVAFYSPASFNNSTEAAAGAWKSYNVNAGWYKIASNAAITFYYTQDDSDDADGTSSTSIAKDGYTYLKLDEGTLYFKSSVNATLTLTEGFVANDDITAFFLTNPNFTGNADGWEGSPIYKSNNVEKYNTTFDVYQTATALPAGYYWIKAQAFDRETNQTATYESASSVSKAYLYAGNASTLVKRIYDDASSTQKNSGTNELSFTKNSTTVYIPNMPGAGEKYFDAGLYDNELLMYHSGGDLRIGIKKYVMTSKDWCLFDNFRIIYAGSTPSNGADMTSLITNPSFESDNTGWSTTGGLYIRTTEGELSNKVGSKYAMMQGKTTNRKTYQSLSTLVEGKYVLSINAKANSDAGTTTLNMGTFSTSIPVGADAATYYVAYETAVSDATAEINISSSGGSGDLRRSFFDNFTLTYYETLPEVSGVDDLLASAMAADKRAALDAANTAYTGSKTAANYNALQTAIVNAKASIAAFEAKTGADADWTGVIVNPNFETGNKNGWSYTGGTSSSWNDPLESGGLGEDGGSYRLAYWTNDKNSSKVYQTISNLPAGNYKLSAYFLTSEGTVVTLNAGSTTYKAIAGSGAAFPVDVYFKLDSKQNIEISGGTISSEAWYHMDNFKLTYNPTLPESISGVSGDMNATVASTQSTRIGTYNNENGQTIANMLSAQEAINAAVDSRIVYNNIATISSNYAAKAALLDAAGQSAYSTATNVASTGAETMYDEGTYTTASEAETAYSRDYITAVKAQTTEGKDMTEAIVNPSFESATAADQTTMTGWTNSGLKTQNNTAFAKAGTYYVEQYHVSGDKYIKQTLTGFHSGVYTLTAVAHANGNTTSPKLYVKVGETESSTAVSSSKDYSVSFNYDGTSTLEIGFSATLDGEGWVCVDNFRLTYDAAALPESLTEVTGYMNADVKTAANTAIATYNSSKTLEDYSAAQAAITDAEASRAIYVTINGLKTTYQGKAVAFLDPAGQAAYTTAVNAEEPDGAATKYENGTYVTALEAELAFMADLAAASKTQTTAGANMTGAIINNSFETGTTDGWTYTTSNDHGAKENSDNTYKMTGVDGSYLFNIWSTGNAISQPLTGMPAGTYRLTAVMGTDAGATFRLKMDDETGNASSVEKGTGVVVSVEKTLATAGDLTVGADAGGSQWYKVDNFQLTYLGVSKELTVAAKAGKYGTIIFPFTPDVSTGYDNITFYSCNLVSGEVLQLSEEVSPAANTPYIIKNDGEDFSLNINGYGDRGLNDSYTSGYLTGIYTNAAIPVSDEDNSHYVLQTQGGVQGFYKVTSALTGVPNRAYLTVPAALGVKAFFFDVTDGINNLNVNDDLNKNEAIYNLAGQRVQKAVKGLYIKNGKKVVIK